MNMLRETGLQILKFWRFSFDFTLSSKNGVSNWNFLNHFCVYSCLVPTNMLTFGAYQHANVNISERKFFAATEHMPKVHV